MLDKYLELKPWEQEGKIYKKVGIRKYRDLWEAYMRLRGKENIITNLSDKPLEERLNITKQLELKHLIPGHAIIGLSGIAALYAERADLVVAVALTEIVGNIYPILLQRYNRGRIQRIINRAQANSSTAPSQPIT